MDLTTANLLTDRLWALTDDVDLAACQTPTNLEAIRAEAVAVAAPTGSGSPVVPVYRDVPHGFCDALARLGQEVAAAGGDQVELVEQALTSTLGFARALQERTPEAITEHGRSQHGEPSPELLMTAEAVLSEPVSAPAEGPMLPLAAVAEVITGVIRDLQLTSWAVEVRTTASARLSVSAQARQVRLWSGATLRASELPGLVVHEVGTHVLRADQGDRQALQLLRRGLPGYLGTEEGLATHHELLVAPAPARLRTFALRVIAADEALRGGLSAVMRRLCEHLPPAAAFPIALRAKRGLADLEAPGSPLKDVVYLRGLRAVRSHLAARPADQALLMAGKLGLQHLDLARQMQADGLLVPAPPRVQTLIEQARQSPPPWSGWPRDDHG